MDKTEPSPPDASWPAWLTKEQAAARLGKPVSVVQHLQYRGYLHPVLRNGIRLYALAEVEALARPGRRPSPWIASPPKDPRHPCEDGPTPHRRAGSGPRLSAARPGLEPARDRDPGRVPPHRVRALHREWTRSLEQGPPPDHHALGDGAELAALAAVAEALFERETDRPPGSGSLGSRWPNSLGSEWPYFLGSQWPSSRGRWPSTHNVAACVARLKALGFHMAIDDLGAGYAGLTSFTQLEPEVAKLDMSLVRGVDTDSRRQSIVRSMKSLCDELGMTVIAEGVETPAERDTLAELGCDLLQGYLFGKPARGFDAVKW